MTAQRRRATKALVFVVTGFTAWCGVYLWAWLAGLEAIAAGGFLIWLVPNAPVAAPPPASWGAQVHDAVEGGR